MKKNFFKDFHNVYDIQKTLKFELKPVWFQNEIQTNSFDKLNEYLLEDKKISEEFKKAKKIIDIYHRSFIEKTLKTLDLKLKNYLKIYTKLNFIKIELKELNKNKEKNKILINEKKKEKKNNLVEFEKEMKKLRNDVANCFKSDKFIEEFNNLFTKKLLNDVIKFINDNKKLYDEEEISDTISCIKLFEKKFTKFTKYNDSRKNIYSDEKIQSSIAYRIIHINLPLFLNNKKVFKKIKKFKIDFSDIINNYHNIFKDKEIKFLFDISNFNKCNTQDQIDIYNEILGGKTENDGKKIKGLNEIVNTFKQQTKIEFKEKFKILQKQILSKHKTNSYVIENYNNYKELSNDVIDYCNKLGVNNVDDSNSILNDIKNMLLNFPEDENNLENIYIKNNMISSISMQIFGEWNIIDLAKIKYVEEVIYPLKNGKKLTENLTKKREKWLKSSFHSICELEKALIFYDKEFLINNEKPIVNHFKKFSMLLIDKENSNVNDNVFVKIKKNFDEFNSFIKCEDIEDIEDKKLDIFKVSLKNLLDSLMNLINYLKPLKLELNKKKVEIEKDEFYNEFDYLFSKLYELNTIYNKCRNYITRKPYNKEKFKLTFGIETFLEGWSRNKEKDYCGVIFKKEGKYFLGILNKKNKKIFENIPNIEEENYYEKMVYDYFNSKNISRCSTQLDEVKQHFKNNVDSYIIKSSNSKGIVITKEIFDLDNNQYFYNEDSKEWDIITNQNKNEENNKNKKGTKKFQYEYGKKDKLVFNEALKTWIGFCIDFLKKYESTKDYDFSNLNIESYENVQKFYNDVNAICYKIDFKKIPLSFIENSVNEGKFYLFEIYNKDYSKYSKGKKNLFTMYWEQIFSSDNLKDVVYTLDGGSEIFFRENKFKMNPAKHFKKVKIAKKLSEDGKLIPSEVVQELNDFYNGKIFENKLSELANKYKNNFSLFQYDINKDHRYYEDKMFFHTSITINYKALGEYSFNEMVLKHLKNNAENVNIIGIDRGERNLLYYYVINSKGEFLEQGSFNKVINGINQIVDYHSLLSAKEKERNDARKSWSVIENIKELKSGYIAQVVHQISKLVYKYNAIIVMEDLNAGFKRGRMKFEKQVYQKFEKALIEKFNYLVVDKSLPANELGSIRKGLQLTPKFESFEKIEKQWGFIFYVNPSYTSKIDPETGFVNFINFRYKNIEKSKETISNFQIIRYNKEKDYFEFKFDFIDFFKNKQMGNKTEWTVCSYGNIRYYYDGKRIEKINVTERLKVLFTNYNINFESGNNLKEVIVNQDKVEFIKVLMFLLQTTFNLRHINKDEEKDIIISPVKDENGNFYCSEDFDNKLNARMPKNADANGAYHISLKGLMLLKKIIKWDENKTFKELDFFINNEDWFQFIQNKKNILY